MKPIFTIHAGEYLVGTHIEKNFKKYNVWFPSKDRGIDLLVTNKGNQKAVSLQVKFSKDFLATHMADMFQQGLKACGWWTINREKLKNSIADYWVFTLYAFKKKDIQFIIITPDIFLNKIDNIHSQKHKTIQTYLWVTEKKKCWETRNLNKADQILVANDAYSNSDRNLTKYLNNWDQLKRKLG